MKSTTKNKPSRRRLAQIYTEAAELVCGGTEYYCCDALHEVDQTGEELDL